MKKHRYAFLYKYIILAAALACVLCFAFVFARYTTGSSTGVTADIASFDVKVEILEAQNNGDENKLDYSISVDGDYSISVDGYVVVKMTNNGDVPVNYMMELSSSNCVIKTAEEGPDPDNSGAPEADYNNYTWDGELKISDGKTVTGENPVAAGGTMYVRLLISFISVDVTVHTETDADDGSGDGSGNTDGNTVHTETDADDGSGDGSGNTDGNHPYTTPIECGFDLVFSYEQAE